MKKLFVATASMALSVCATAAVKPAPQLVFDASKGVAGLLHCHKAKPLTILPTQICITLPTSKIPLIST